MRITEGLGRMSIRLMRALWTPGSALERSDLPLAGSALSCQHDIYKKMEIDVDVDRDKEKQQLITNVQESEERSR